MGLCLLWINFVPPPADRVYPHDSARLEENSFHLSVGFVRNIVAARPIVSYSLTMQQQRQRQ